MVAEWELLRFDDFQSRMREDDFFRIKFVPMFIEGFKQRDARRFSIFWSKF